VARRDASGCRKDVTNGNDNGTDGQTDRRTDRQSATQYAAPSQGGGPHNNGLPDGEKRFKICLAV